MDHFNEPGSQLGARRLRAGQFSNKGETVTTVGSIEREKVSREAVLPTLLERSVHVERANLSRRQAGHSHQPDTLLALLSS